MSIFASVLQAAPKYHVELIKRSKDGLCITRGFSDYTEGLINIDISFINSSIKLFNSIPDIVNKNPDMIIFPDVYRKRHQTLNLIYKNNIPVISRDGIAPHQLQNEHGTTISMTNLYANQAKSIYSFVQRNLKKNNRKKTTVILILNESYQYAKRLGSEIEHVFNSEYNNDISVVRIRYANELPFYKVQDGDYFISLLFEPMSTVFYLNLIKTNKKVTLIYSDLGVTDNSFAMLWRNKKSKVDLYFVTNGKAIFSKSYLNFMKEYCPEEEKNNYGMMLFEMLDMSYRILKEELLTQMPFIEAMNHIKYSTGFSREPYTYNDDGVCINKTIISQMVMKCNCSDIAFAIVDDDCQCPSDQCKCVNCHTHDWN